MLKMTVAVVVHLVLLALACTHFTLVTGWASGSWTCDFCTYCYADGWGHVYQSDYTLPVIITYLAAYAAGIAVYGLAWGAGSRWIAGIGLALCIVGLVSFGIEGSHWVWSHNLSWIASFPVVMFPLAVVAGYPIQKGRIEQTQKLITRSKSGGGYLGGRSWLDFGLCTNGTSFAIGGLPAELAWALARCQWLKMSTSNQYGSDSRGTSDSLALDLLFRFRAMSRLRQDVELVRFHAISTISTTWLVRHSTNSGQHHGSLAANHQNRASNLLGSILRHGLACGWPGRAVEVAGPSGWRVVGPACAVSSSVGFLGAVQADSRVIGKIGGEVLAWECGRQGFTGLPFFSSGRYGREGSAGPVNPPKEMAGG